jgi:hypothetical protein
VNPENKKGPDRNPARSKIQYPMKNQMEYFKTGAN